MDNLNKSYITVVLSVALPMLVIGAFIGYSTTGSYWTMVLAGSVFFLVAAIFISLLFFITNRWFKRVSSVNLKDNPMKAYFLIYLANGGVIVLSYILGHDAMPAFFLGAAYIVGLICFFIDMYIKKKYGKSVGDLLDADAKIDEKHFTYQFLGLMFIILAFLFVLLVYIDIKLFSEFFLWLLDVIVKLF